MAQPKRILSFSFTPQAAPISSVEVIGEKDVFQLVAAPLGKGVVATQLQQPVGPGRVLFQTPPVVALPGHSAAHRGHHVVGELDQMEGVMRRSAQKWSTATLAGEPVPPSPRIQV